MDVEQRQVTAEMLVEAVEMETGVQLTREQAGCVLSASWLAANWLTAHNLPALESAAHPFPSRRLLQASLL